MFPFIVGIAKVVLLAFLLYMVVKCDQNRRADAELPMPADRKLLADRSDRLLPVANASAPSIEH